MFIYIKVIIFLYMSKKGEIIGVFESIILKNGTVYRTTIPAKLVKYFMSMNKLKLNKNYKFTIEETNE